ncbi:hypothetical protein B0H14DRAFT_2625958 [Mycena olivaceomarginata]|nr:hypothetical protein B0H14DRAFT_2625958 [Mycena olivaceomarginata]
MDQAAHFWLYTSRPKLVTGDLDDKESFLAICDQFTDRVRREKDPTGRNVRRHIPKTAEAARCKVGDEMVSSELCAGNLEAAVEFGKLMKWEGPWICAGDGTKNMSHETIGGMKDSTHRV